MSCSIVGIAFLSSICDKSNLKMHLTWHLNFFALLLSITEAHAISQLPLVNNPLVQNMKTPSPPKENDLMLRDVIAKFRNVNAFIGFTRNFESITQAFGDSSQNNTILAPMNSDILGLSLKPWEDSNDYVNFGAKAYDGNAGDDRADQNLRMFVETHILPISPWNEGVKVKTLSGKECWWQIKDGVRKVCPLDLYKVYKKITKRYRYTQENWKLLKY